MKMESAAFAVCCVGFLVGAFAAIFVLGEAQTFFGFIVMVASLICGGLTLVARQNERECEREHELEMQKLQLKMLQTPLEQTIDAPQPQRGRVRR